MPIDSEIPFDQCEDVRLPSARDLLAPVFRHVRGGLLVALLILAATGAAVVLAPRKYQADMTLLVKRERAESVVSPGPNVVAQRPAEVSEEELNSEVELLRSRDLLEQVALAAGLAPQAPASGEVAQEGRAALARAVRNLESNLDVEPVRKTALIRVRFTSADSVQAARVLDDLARLYLEKHLAVHRPAGAHAFFSEQADRFRGELSEAEERLREYGRREGVVAADAERESTLRQLAEFQAALEHAHAQVAEATRRMRELQASTGSTSSRMTTQIKTSDNPQLMAALKGKVLDLELKRTELLRKFVPTYPPVVDVEGQLAQARAALDAAGRAPATEEVTDANPTYQWLQNELARVRADREAAAARGAALAQSVSVFRERARQLDEKSAAQQELKRTLKTAEDNYLLYLKKQEEARISDALDRTRIANVAIAEPAGVPVLPTSAGRSLIALIGLAAAALLGLATTYVLHFASPYFHTPQAVEDALGIPVLAAFPAGR